MPLELVVAVDPCERSSTYASIELPDGVGWSSRPFARHDERLAVGRREEEAAALVVSKQLDGEQRQAARLLEPAQVAGGDVQFVEPVRDVRVVVEVAGARGPMPSR